LQPLAAAKVGLSRGAALSYREVPFARPGPAMTDTITPFAADFPAASEAQWRGLVDKILKGSSFDKRLVTRTADGLAIKPLYTRAHAADVDGATRGHHRPAWDIRQICAEAEPAAANAAILDDLKGGVTSTVLTIAAPGWSGLDYHEDALAQALDGVLLDVCPVGLWAGEYTPDAAGSLLAIWRKAGLKTEQCQGAFNYDPLGTLAYTGALYQPLDKALAVAANLVLTAQGHPYVTALKADGHIWHNAGATEAQELGLCLATAVAYLRACEAAAIPPTDALGKIAFIVAVDADQFLGIAKIRALRRCVARLAEACGAASANPHVAAITSYRMLTRRDPWVNMLRTTMACTAAALGGADAITVLPYSWAIGRPDAFARRTARNTHHVLQEESYLGRVQDPAGGSWYVEALTSDLAQAAWAVFQDLERRGGLGAALQSGHIQDLLAASATRRAEQVARGKIELTGTSAFPLLGSDGANIQPWPSDALSADLPGTRARPLVCARLSEPFERLRDLADAAGVAGPAPRVFLATLGPLADHAARAAWMRNLLASGGIEAVGCQPLLTSMAVGQAFADSGAAVVCLCAADAHYAELGEATAQLLKTAGAKAIYVAGKPKDEALLRSAGVDGFIFAGGDMIETLTQIQAHLGIGPDITGDSRS
jgi:methylmalonyl-CoA mutase